MAKPPLMSLREGEAIDAIATYHWKIMARCATPEERLIYEQAQLTLARYWQGSQAGRRVLPTQSAPTIQEEVAPEYYAYYHLTELLRQQARGMMIVAGALLLVAACVFIILFLFNSLMGGPH